MKPACMDHQIPPAWTIKTRLILVTHIDDLSWYAGTDGSSKPQQDCQQTKCYARADPVLNHNRLYSNWLYVSGKLSYQQQVGNSWAIEMRADHSYQWVLQQQPIQGQGHQSSGVQVVQHVLGSGWRPTDRNQTQLRSQMLQQHYMTVRVRRTQQFLMMSVQITHKINK